MRDHAASLPTIYIYSRFVRLALAAAPRCAGYRHTKRFIRLPLSCVNIYTYVTKMEILGPLNVGREVRFCRRSCRGRRQQDRCCALAPYSTTTYGWGSCCVVLCVFGVSPLCVVGPRLVLIASKIKYIDISFFCQQRPHRPYISHKLSSIHTSPLYHSTRSHMHTTHRYTKIHITHSRP